MEHITITQLNRGYVRLTPEAGYILFNNRTRTTFSEAVVLGKYSNMFSAIELTN